MTITARGFGLLAGAGALLGTGFLFGYPELAVLGCAGLIALGCAVGQAGWRPRLAVRRTAEPDRVGRGEAAVMTLIVRNGARLHRVSLVAQDRCGGRPVPVPLLRLRPGRVTTVSYPVPTHRRGVVPVGPLRVTRRDALGLIGVTRSYGDTARVWVHPRIHPLRAVPTGVARSMDGRLDRVPHGAITFDSLREYVVGDELRRVHWRTSARVGELMVREDVDTSLPRIVVLLDNRSEVHPHRGDGVAETFESACEAAASLVAAAARDNLPVTLLLVTDDGDGTDHEVGGDDGSNGAGGDHSRAADHGADGDHLDRLAAADLRPDPDGAALRGVTARLRRHRLGDTLVFLTGPGARGDLGRVAGLCGAYPAVLAGVFGGADTTAARIDGLIVLDAADGAEFAARWDGVMRW